MFGLALTGLFLAAAADPAPAAGDDAPLRPGWVVSAAAATGTPTVFPDGLAIGALVEGEHHLGRGPLFLSARLGWTLASAANDTWLMDHHQSVAAVGAGADAVVGEGRIWAQAGGGVGALYEVMSRHQRQRIDAAGVPGGVQTALSAGAHAFAEVGVALHLRGPFTALLAGGPTLTQGAVDDQATGGRATRWTWGGGARLGVACEF